MTSYVSPSKNITIMNTDKHGPKSHGEIVRMKAFIFIWNTDCFWHATTEKKVGHAEVQWIIFDGLVLLISAILHCAIPKSVLIKKHEFVFIRPSQPVRNHYNCLWDGCVLRRSRWDIGAWLANCSRLCFQDGDDFDVCTAIARLPSFLRVLTTADFRRALWVVGRWQSETNAYL